MRPARRLAPLAMLLGLTAGAQAPAERVPAPKPEPCVPFAPELGEEDLASPEGLSYGEVKAALAAVIQAALYCRQPEGMAEVHLTFDLVVGCNGIVSAIEAIDQGGAPADYVACVSSVISRADFPAHDIAEGMPVTYPVNAAW